MAQIVYSTSWEYVGYPNKNIGDAFLLVYKISESEIDTLEDGSISIDPYNPKINNIADLSIISVLKTLYQLNTDENVLKYNRSKRLNKRMNNYKVKLGFGVHFGWAIEGALGSYYKIDTTYSSSHVNITMYLESLTKHYGSTILLSGDLYDILSINGKKMCRGVDQLYDTRTGSFIRLFWIDISLDSLHIKKQKLKLNRKGLYIQKLIEREANIK